MPNIYQNLIPFKIHCRNCGAKHPIYKTDEIPNDIIRLECNWCPNCEGSIDELYEEFQIKRKIQKNYNNTKSNLKDPDLFSNIEILIVFILIGLS